MVLLQGVIRGEEPAISGRGSEEIKLQGRTVTCVMKSQILFRRTTSLFPTFTILSLPVETNKARGLKLTLYLKGMKEVQNLGTMSWLRLCKTRPEVFSCLKLREKINLSNMGGLWPNGASKVN